MKIRGSNYRVYKKLLKAIGSLIFGLVGISIVMAASANYKSDGKRHRGFSAIINEIQQLDGFHKYQALGVGGFLTVIAVMALYVFQKDKQIIIELDFNDENRVLMIKSQTLFSKQTIEASIPYDNLTSKNDECFDLLAGNKFKAIQIANSENSTSGYILKGHYTWKDNDIRLVEMKINELGKKIED